ncbi:MAG: hypothetical protein H6736_02990 [Alphaproteobacteria bacterium]|nr:hypothetical protein [Alphaproteobacteria bacterium]MCB9690760.1 hypothetical protein [Alphaproteobacteria bacterium]
MTTGRPSVGQALEQVAAWKAAQLDENRTKIAEVDTELSKLQATLANLQEQLASLQQAREQLGTLDLSDGLITRSYEAIFDALRHQAGEVVQRASATAAAERARRDQVFAEIQTGELAPLAAEYTQFKEQVAPTLAALPESYRGAIQQHHQGITEKLRSFLATRFAGPADVDAAPIEVEVVFGVDAPEGTPEVLICVLPITDVTFTHWNERDTDLSTLIGARVAQSIYETTKRTGPAGAQAIRGGHQGLLAMEVDLDGASADFATVLQDTMKAVLGGAPELAAAKVSITPRQVDFDYLLPPEAEDEEA